MSDKPPVPKKKVGKKSKKKSETSSPRTPKSRKSSPPSSPKPSEKEPVPKLYISSKICPIHKKEYKLYCTNREELLCEECSQNSLYSRLPSRPVPLEEAFRLRLSGLYNTLNNYILPKRLQIDTQKMRAAQYLAIVKLKKSEIERDMKGEFSAMNERLNFSYGTKQAVLQHDLKELQIDLDRISHIINIIESSANDQISFLQRSRDLKALMDLSLSKPFRVKIEVRSDDLPKEMDRVREIVSDFSATKELIKLKDELIWKLIHEQPTEKEMNEAHHRELAEWARLAEKYTHELRKFQVNCWYCGCVLAEETVNTNCPKNLRGESRGNFKLEGTGRHYFSDEPRPSVRSSSPATKDSEVSIRDLSRIVKQKQIPLQKIFNSQDPLKTGVIRAKEFGDVIANVFEISKAQTAYVSAKFDKKKNGEIVIAKFLKAINKEILKESLGLLLDKCRHTDEEFHGVIRQDYFIKNLEEIGIVVDNLSVFKHLDIDDHGNVDYLNFIAEVKSKKR